MAGSDSTGVATDMITLNSTLVAALSFFVLIEASVHDYADEKFTAKGNAFVVHGGSEGIYSSVPDTTNASLSSANGDSFIRFEKVTFRRPSEYANFSSTPHAIIFEVEDRDTIGGSAYGGQRAVCCTADLTKLGAYTEGEIVERE